MRQYFDRLELSAEEKAIIRKRYRETKDRRIAERLLCLLMKEEGLTHEIISRILGVSEGTISRWIGIYQERGLKDFCQLSYEGDPGELTQEQLEELKAELRRCMYHNAKEVGAFIEERFGIKYSERGIQKLLKRLEFTFQKSKLTPPQADPKAQKSFVEWYEQTKEKLGERNRLYFVDAAHVVHNVLPGYGWAPIGERPTFPSNSGRERLSLLGAYCPLDGEWVSKDIARTINAHSVVEFVDHLQELHPQAERIILIMDNARYNHARVVREHITGTMVELVYLPSYSPHLNLVERMWRFMKKKVMRNQFYKTFTDFVAAIKRFFARISDYTDELLSLMRDKFHILECA